jgi:hypothetical protein
MVGISRLRDTVCTLAGATEDHIAKAMMASRGGSDDACVLVIGR